MLRYQVEGEARKGVLRGETKFYAVEFKMAVTGSRD